MKGKFIPTLLVLLSFNSANVAQTGKAGFPLIPTPRNITPGDGTFKIDPATIIHYNNPEAVADIEVFNGYLQQVYGFALKTKESAKEKKSHFNVRIVPLQDAESYNLNIDSTGIFLEAANSTGIFYGLQTIRQLLPPGRSGDLRIPALSIEDSPRFKYRGMHLDVARHFFSVEAVKRYIDYLAMYKFNYFHWHLTDDQGWRLEIKKHPKLHETGGWRKGTLTGHYFDKPAVYDSVRYGGYYTQEEVKDVIQYATARHITIVPEIEMPGHALAALAAYPELSCTGGPFETGKTWGVYDDVFCTREETFTFLQDVLDEVCALFPGKYVHIGGDECPKTRWKECDRCRKNIERLKLKDEHALQEYFTGRISEYLRTKNKTAIGWDEILAPGLDSHAVIMSWRGYAGGLQGAKSGHDVIMSPYSHCYFDYYQSRYSDTSLAIGGYLPVEKVYMFNPVPDGLNEEEAERIIGAQGNVWTEYIRTEERLQEMIFPRMSALSEVLWSPAEARNYSDFALRLSMHFKFLSLMNIKYSRALYDISSRVSPGEGRDMHIELSSTFPGGKIFYTLNGDVPKLSSKEYKERITVDQSVGLKAALYVRLQQPGSVFSQRFNFTKSTGKKITLLHKPHPEYSVNSGFALVDGVTGRLPWMPEDWIGFSGTDFHATVDLGVTQTVSRVILDVLEEEAGKIFLPTEVRVFTGDDGENFTLVAMLNAEEIKRMNRRLRLDFQPVQSKFVRVVAMNANSKDWLFVDELSVE